MLKKVMSRRCLFPILLLLILAMILALTGFNYAGQDKAPFDTGRIYTRDGPVPDKDDSNTTETTVPGQDSSQKLESGNIGDPSLMDSQDIISIKADGTGDYGSLEEAIQAVQEGGTIFLGPGKYELAAKLEIKKSLTLVGTGDVASTAINGMEGPYVILFSGQGPFVADNVTFTYSGTAKSDVFDIKSGNLVFNNCQFTGAVKDPNDEGQYLGGGIYLYGDANVLIQGCSISYNGHVGIRTEENSTATIIDSICQGNSGDGIIFSGNSNGFADHNKTMDSPDWGGISVQDNAFAVLLNNTSTDNNEYGIGYYHNSGGFAINNTCTGNDIGFYVAETANPKLKNNTCNNNGTDFWDDRVK